MRDLFKIALEGIDHLEHSTFGKLLEEEFSKLRKYSIVKDKDLLDTKISKIIAEQTGLNIRITTEESDNAYVFVPDLNKNNPIMNKWRRYYLDNVDAKDFFADKHIVEGTVSLKEARVSGDFSKIAVSIVIGSEFLRKKSDYTVPEVTAILLHELGHTFVYFEMLARCTRTNYILSEGVKRLMTSNTREERIILLEKIEDITHVKIKDKEGLSNKKRTEKIYRSVIVDNIVQESKQDLNLNVYDSRSFEQLADNFSARFGYAVPLATGLAKTYKIYGDTVYLTPMMNILFNIIKVIGLVCLSVLNPFQGGFTITVILLQGSPLDVTYDPPKKRILKIKQQINDVLKDSKLSMKQKQVFIEEHEEIEAILDTMYDNIGVYETLWTYIFPWGIRQKSLIEVQEELESMYNNDLFASAAKLDVLKLEEHEEVDVFKDLDIALEEYTKAAYKTEQFMILEDYIQTANITNISLEDYGDLSKLAGVNISQEDIGDILKHGIQFILKHLGVIIVALIAALRLFLIFKDTGGSSNGGSGSPIVMTSTLKFKIDGVDFKLMEKIKEHITKNNHNIFSIYESVKVDGDSERYETSYKAAIKKMEEEYSRSEKMLMDSSPSEEHGDIKKVYTSVRERVLKHISGVFGNIQLSINLIQISAAGSLSEHQLKDDLFLQNVSTNNIYKTLEVALKELVFMTQRLKTTKDITYDIIGNFNQTTYRTGLSDSIRNDISKKLAAMKTLFFEKNYNYIPFTAKYLVAQINGNDGRIHGAAIPHNLMIDVKIDERSKSKKFFWDYDYIGEGNVVNQYITTAYKDFYFMDKALEESVDKLVDNNIGDAFFKHVSGDRFRLNLPAIDIDHLKKYFSYIDSKNPIIQNSDRQLNILEKYSKDSFTAISSEDVLKNIDWKDIEDFNIFENITFKDLVHKHALIRYHSPVGKICNESMALVTIIKSISKAAKESKKLSDNIYKLEQTVLKNKMSLKQYLSLAVTAS